MLILGVFTGESLVIRWGINRSLLIGENLQRVVHVLVDLRGVEQPLGIAGDVVGGEVDRIEILFLVGLERRDLPLRGGSGVSP